MILFPKYYQNVFRSDKSTSKIISKLTKGLDNFWPINIIQNNYIEKYLDPLVEEEVKHKFFGKSETETETYEAIAKKIPSGI